MSNYRIDEVKFWELYVGILGFFEWIFFLVFMINFKVWELEIFLDVYVLFRN